MTSPGHLVLPVSQSSTKLHQLAQSCVQSSSEYLQMWYLWRQLLWGSMPVFYLLQNHLFFLTHNQNKHVAACLLLSTVQLWEGSPWYLSLQVVVVNCSSNFLSTNLSLFSYAECSSPLTTLIAFLWAPPWISQIGNITVGVVSPGWEQRVVQLTCWLCFCWQIPLCGHPSL